jgi:hypothetical protein
MRIPQRRGNHVATTPRVTVPYRRRQLADLSLIATTIARQVDLRPWRCCPARVQRRPPGERDIIGVVKRHLGALLSLAIVGCGGPASQLPDAAAGAGGVSTGGVPMDGGGGSGGRGGATGGLGGSGGTAGSDGGAGIGGGAGAAGRGGAGGGNGGSGGAGGTGGAAGARTLSFRTPVYYDTQGQGVVGGILPGDWNGDGKADLALMTSGDMRVALGNGDGTFGPQAMYARPANTNFVAAADFNGDRRVDIMTQSPSGVGVMFGNGDGTFQTRVDFAVAINWLTVGDFTSDGKSDFIFRMTDLSWTVAISKGDGTFASLPGPDLHGDIPDVFADFDGDGDLDFAVVEWDAGKKLEIYLGRGDGTFQIPTGYVATGVGSPLAGDYDGDGNMDLAAAVSGGVDVWFGNGDGTFERSPHPRQSGRMIADDFNGDGRSDEIQAGASALGEYLMAVSLSRGDGTFDPVAYDLARRPVSLAYADWNGDGHADIAVTQTDRIAFFLSDTDGALRGIVHYDKPPSMTMGLTVYGGATIGDWNGDGKLDLAESDYNQNRVCVRLGSGDGTFQPSINCAAASVPQELVTGDWNGDGRADLLVVNDVVIFGLGPMTHFTILLGRGDGMFDPLPMDLRSVVLKKIATGDIDADGKLDFVAMAPYIAIFLGNGDGTFRSGAGVGYQGSSYRVDLVDVNGDRKLDIVNLTDATFSVALGNGDGSFQAATTGPRPDFIGAVFGDWNGDGKADMAVGGSLQTASRIVLGGAALASSVTADFDGDGRFDVANLSSAGVEVRVNDGAGGLKAPLIISVGFTAPQLFGGDLNRDGRPDLVVGSYNVVLNSSH